MTSRKIRKGLHYAHSDGVAGPTAVRYPDHDAAEGLSATPTDSVFDVGGRDAIVYAISMDQGTSSPRLVLRKHGTTDNVVSLRAGAVGQHHDYGPEGIRIPGGFEIAFLDTNTFAFTIAYEVV